MSQGTDCFPRENAFSDRNRSNGSRDIVYIRITRNFFFTVTASSVRKKY